MLTADVMLRNDVADALQRRDAVAARGALQLLLSEHPSDDLLPALSTLTRALEEPRPERFGGHDALQHARGEITREVMPAAARVFGDTAGSAWLAPFWRALAHAAGSRKSLYSPVRRVPKLEIAYVMAIENGTSHLQQGIGYRNRPAHMSIPLHALANDVVDHGPLRSSLLIVDEVPSRPVELTRRLDVARIDLQRDRWTAQRRSSRRRGHHCSHHRCALSFLHQALPYAPHIHFDAGARKLPPAGKRIAQKDLRQAI
ncbi:hypothetical protein [Cupriavidus sp. D39]|uniref:hypothetical protein n=1 Tax=Cupriavidus sp. D39 TaxID=2997877 RepID=UPI00226F81C9|nr:hypothetical protein [Cupriavidus sp. D39]MCY0852607.1 hypothetical protein [Cupriavidus sp. D39]